MACEKVTISNFLREQSVLIIGANDVITESLIEKILNHCDVWHIYVVFHNPSGSEKISYGKNDKVIFKNGNLSQHNLGLNQDDVRLLRENVSLVIHTGVTDYKATLIDAVKVNLLGTLEVLNLCGQIKNLKGLVHLSTAFPATDDDIIKEVIYQQPIDPEILIEYSKWMNDFQLEDFLKKLQVSVNGFVLTKCMSEELIEQNSGFPAAIVRPSIVSEMCDSFLPIEKDSVVLESNRDDANRGNRAKLAVDLVPANRVVNFLLAASWYLVAYRPNLPVVYHCTGSINLPVNFVQSRRIDFYGKWNFLKGIKIDYENLYKPYLKEIFRYENNNGKHLEKIMNEEDKNIFDINTLKISSTLIKKTYSRNNNTLLSKRYDVLLNTLLFLFWKKWILKSTPATHVIFAAIMFIYGLFKVGKNLKKFSSSL